MRLIFKVALLTLTFLNASITLASSCDNEYCKIIILDAPYRDTVYDISNFLEKKTNADAIEKILLRSDLVGIRITTRRTGPHWLNSSSKFDEVINLDPDLIILHGSAFYVPNNINLTIDYFNKSINYLSYNLDSEFLVYGSNFSLVGGRSNYEKYLLRSIPQLKGRLTVISIRNRSFQSSRVSRDIVGTVNSILGL